MSNLYVPVDARADRCGYLNSDRRRDSIIGLVSPKMLAQIPSGGTYFFFAGFAVLAFFTTRKSTHVLGVQR